MSTAQEMSTAKLVEIPYHNLYCIPTHIESDEYTGNLYIVAKDETEALRKWEKHVEVIPGTITHGQPRNMLQHVIV